MLLCAFLKLHAPSGREASKILGNFDHWTPRFQAIFQIGKIKIEKFVFWRLVSLNWALTLQNKRCWFILSGQSIPQSLKMNENRQFWLQTRLTIDKRWIRSCSPSKARRKANGFWRKIDLNLPFQRHFNVFSNEKSQKNFPDLAGKSKIHFPDRQQIFLKNVEIRKKS